MTVWIDGFEYGGRGLCYGLSPDQRRTHVPGTGIQTNGIGKSFDAHLNRKVSMEDDTQFFIRNGHIPFGKIRSWRESEDD